MNLWKWHIFVGRNMRGRAYMVYEWLVRRRMPCVSITTDPACPCKCKCCPWEVFRDASSKFGMPRLSLDSFEKMLRNIPKNVLLEFSGFGDSTTNPAMPDMVSLAKGKGYRVQTFTTLVGLDRRGAEILSQSNLEKITIHIPDDRYFIYPADKWLEQLRLLDGLKFKTIVFCTLGRVPEEIKKQVERRGKIIYLRLINKSTLYKRSLYRRVGSLKCRCSGKRLNLWGVWPNGDVSVCCFDYAHENIIGNLLTQTYEQIKNGEPIKLFRAAMTSKNDDCLCRHCEESAWL